MLSHPTITVPASGCARSGFYKRSRAQHAVGTLLPTALRLAIERAPTSIELRLQLGEWGSKYSKLREQAPALLLPCAVAEPALHESWYTSLYVFRVF